MKHPELKQPKVTGEPVPVECVTVAADGGNVTESVTECEIQENVTPDYDTEYLRRSKRRALNSASVVYSEKFNCKTPNAVSYGIHAEIII